MAVKLDFRFAKYPISQWDFEENQIKECVLGLINLQDKAASTVKRKTSEEIKHSNNLKHQMSLQITEENMASLIRSKNN